jgi:hypothetical protein
MSAWGASVADAAVSVTFDNLGEAAQLELGMWPEDVPQGEHFTVRDVLPRLLDVARTGARARRAGGGVRPVAPVSPRRPSTPEAQAV